MRKFYMNDPNDNREESIACNVCHGILGGIRKLLESTTGIF